MCWLTTSFFFKSFGDKNHFNSSSRAYSIISHILNLKNHPALQFYSFMSISHCTPQKKLQIAVFSRFLYSYKIWIVHTAVYNLLTIFPFGQDPEKLPARLCLSCFLAIVWNKKPFGLRVIRADIWYTIPYEFKHFGWQIVYIRKFCNILTYRRTFFSHKFKYALLWGDKI